MDRVEQNQPIPDYKSYVAQLAQLHASWDGLEGAELIAASVEKFGDRLAVTSSFGSESVVELHMLSQISPSTKVIFLNTGKLFGETLSYLELVKNKLGLTNISVMEPDLADKKKLDPKGVLWNSNPDQCCHFRKTLPQERALKDIDAIITGRKRFQTAARQNLPFVDLVKRPEGFDGLRWTINPLAAWSLDEIHTYIEKQGLPRHPLVKDGFLSIGCMPCTDRTTPEDYRAGRWVGRGKEECGIHQNSFVDGDGI